MIIILVFVPLPFINTIIVFDRCFYIFLKIILFYFVTCENWLYSPPNAVKIIFAKTQIFALSTYPPNLFFSFYDSESRLFPANGMSVSIFFSCV